MSTEDTKKVGRPPGPPKRRITIYLFESTIEVLATKARIKGEGLPAYLARNIEKLAGKL